MDSDGRITIDTTLNTRGFSKGSADLTAAINALSKTVTDLGAKIDSAFSKMGTSSTTAGQKVTENM